VLTGLHVRDLALVEEIWLEFGSGLTVLSGETGAGKTVLVTALKLLLGERADSTLVRGGAAEALVEGTFLLDGREVLVRRRIAAEGRSRCTVDGEMATVAMLAELLGAHVDLHGQHEHQALLSPARHAGYLDRFAEPSGGAVRAYRAAWHEWTAARARLAEIEGALADRDRRAGHLRFQLSDIDSVAPRLGEHEELDARLPRLRHAERLRGAAGNAWAALKDEDGASDRLSAALASLATARGLDPSLDAVGDAVGRLDVELQELAGALRAYAEDTEHDPAVLDETERRLQQLSDLMRKYGPSMAAVLDHRRDVAAELELLDAGEAGVARAEEALGRAEKDLRVAAGALVAVRDEAVGPFTNGLSAACAELALPHASFAVSRTSLPFDGWIADGPERVEFLFASGSGESPRPLAKVASGGEVSRVMLALKSVLGAADCVPVLVFDEVDAGIGGATALSVGRRLASLAAEHQVLVVTHLPQVAAYAASHVVVSKDPSGGRTVTTARRIAGDAIVIEIARMLSGSASDAGLAHARELLAEAAAFAKG